MSCVSPPLLKKPSRGFAWACGPCSKAQEKKLEARNTPNVTDHADGDDDETLDGDNSPVEDADTLDTTASSTTSSDTEREVHVVTEDQKQQASLWRFRYLGIHCEVEDALDYDDRIYPRASSRLGAKHQATVLPWPGKPVEYVKPVVEPKRKYMKHNKDKKDHKISKEVVATMEAEKARREARPKWIQDEPVGYVHRGEDHDNDDPACTSQLLFKIPDVGEASERGMDDERGMGDSVLDRMTITQREKLVSDYISRVKVLAEPLGLPKYSTNLLDVALNLLRKAEYNVEDALTELKMLEKKDFKEPDLSAAEMKKFEDGVAKYGSEWHSIKKHVKSVSAGDIVRLYYTWKKTDRGKQVWGNYHARKGKKEAKKAEAATKHGSVPIPGKLQDDVADEHDDSAFDNEKATEKRRQFQCKFCATRSSRQWRRAPNTLAGTMVTENGTKPSSKEKGPQHMVALCRRCAELWRRYGIQWEDAEEVARKVAQAGGRAGKRRIDEELLHELVAANEVVNQPVTFPNLAPGLAVPAPVSSAAGSEPPKKKLKGSAEKDSLDTTPDPKVMKKKAAPIVVKSPSPPPAPAIPQPRVLPCAICTELEPLCDDKHLSCRECRLTVHRDCYGVVGDVRPGKWVCDMCSNDKNPQVSIVSCHSMRLCGRVLII